MGVRGTRIHLLAFAQAPPGPSCGASTCLAIQPEEMTWSGPGFRRQLIVVREGRPSTQFLPYRSRSFSGCLVAGLAHESANPWGQRAARPRQTDIQGRPYMGLWTDRHSGTRVLIAAYPARPVRLERSAPALAQGRATHRSTPAHEHAGYPQPRRSRPRAHASATWSELRQRQ